MKINLTTLRIGAFSLKNAQFRIIKILFTFVNESHESCIELKAKDFFKNTLPQA